MNQPDFERYTESLPQVTRVDNFGYALFFYESDQRTPFVSIADSDNDFDAVSDLNRAGVFRLNIGVGSDTYQRLIPSEAGELDYTEKNRFMAHPHYAAQKFICILNPEGDQLQETMQLIQEAHELAQERFIANRGMA